MKKNVWRGLMKNCIPHVSTFQQANPTTQCHNEVHTFLN